MLSLPFSERAQQVCCITDRPLRLCSLCSVQLAFVLVQLAFMLVQASR